MIGAVMRDAGVALWMLGDAMGNFGASLPAAGVKREDDDDVVVVGAAAGSDKGGGAGVVKREEDDDVVVVEVRIIGADLSK